MAPSSMRACAVDGFDDRRAAGCVAVRHRPRPHRLREGRELRRPVGAPDRRAWRASACRCRPVKHQYVITETIAGLARDIATVRDPDRRTYFKEEVGGLVFGGYEPDRDPWTIGRCAGRFRIPALRRRLGSFRAAYDPGAGPGAGARDHRHQADDPRPRKLHPRWQFHPRRAPPSSRISSSAPASTLSASPSPAAPAGCSPNGCRRARRRMDLWVVDIRRFSEHSPDRHWVCDRTLEAYGQALHDRLSRMRNMRADGRASFRRSMSGSRPVNACFGSKLGWERPNWFAATGCRAARHLFHGPAELVRRGRRGAPRGARARPACSTRSSFAKFEMTRQGCRRRPCRWIAANDVARPPGRITYTQMLNRAAASNAISPSPVSRDEHYLHRHRHRLPQP